MKIMVTGGAGFIGFHTSKALLERGDEVVIVDNFNDYYDVSLKRARIEELKKSGNPKVVKADISYYDSVENIFKKEDFDKICHLAAQAGVRSSLENPTAYVNNNVIGTYNILELCRKFGVENLVFASSSSVYGGNKKLPFSESDTTESQVSLYGATKKINETFAKTYHNAYGINCTSLRYFTCYGPFGRPDMALFLFTKSILDGKEIEVFNRGDMKRDFTYIDDIVSGTLAALDRAYPFEIFNLARGEQMDLNYFINEIEKNLRIKAKKAYLPMQVGDMKETYGDISKARKMLGYNPKTSLKGGVKRFVDWYLSYYNIKK